MKIAFDAKRAFNNKTGLGNYSRFIISGFLKIQNILAFTPKANLDNFPGFPANQIVVSDKPLWRSWSILKDLRKLNVDVYHGLSNEIPFSLKNAGIKTVVSIHDLIFVNYPQYYSFIDRQIYTFKLRFAIKYADKIIAISKQTKDDILKFCPNIEASKIQVVYQNCDEKFYQNITQDEILEVKNHFHINKPYIVSVGTLEARKNQLKLIKAFEKLNNSAVELILVGRGKKYKLELENYISEHNLTNVRILSNVDNPQLRAIYAGSVFSAYISIVEGFGIPIVESLACGRPVLAAKGTCLEEAGGPGGLYVDPFSIEEISAGMKKLLESSELRASLIEKGKIHIQQFEQSKIVAQINAIYSSLF